LFKNGIGAEGAVALADALKVNSSVTSFNLGWNCIGAVGASALADALKVNASLKEIGLISNVIGAEGSLALADTLKVKTSVTSFDLRFNGIDASELAHVDELIARNKRLRHLFLFDARRMLLSLMCADWCGVVWPYLLDGDDADDIEATDNVETLRAEFAAVVEERRLRAATGLYQ
jgi:hypothetical protein